MVSVELYDSAWMHTGCIRQWSFVQIEKLIKLRCSLRVPWNYQQESQYACQRQLYDISGEQIVRAQDTSIFLSFSLQLHTSKKKQDENIFILSNRIRIFMNFNFIRTIALSRCSCSIVHLLSQMCIAYPSFSGQSLIWIPFWWFIFVCSWLTIKIGFGSYCTTFTCDIFWNVIPKSGCARKNCIVNQMLKVSSEIAFRSTANHLNSHTIEIYKCIWDERIHLAASLARLRIKNSALSLLHLLPSHLQDNKVAISTANPIVMGWINPFRLR